jgi:2-keto-4-pentenoate hydratase/2-oxohepta-3-ene-1,7-dioic acid hydratase in catechol pathway
MKLVSFKERAPQGTRAARIGAIVGDQIVDLSAADSALPSTMQELIAGGPAGLQAAKSAAQSGKGRLPRNAVEILAPLPRPARNIFCVGKNYHEHAVEFDRSGFNATQTKDAIPSFPIIFTKASNSVIGEGKPIPAHLDPTTSVDYEGELAVVIGKGGIGISKEKALDHVFGYTIVNDVTSRLLQKQHQQWFLGKSIDGFCPMGPAIVTADEITDPRALRLQTFVNGELRQDAMVSQLIFDIPTLIETLSRTITLEPGDIVATGTCAGVGIGFDPPKYMSRGDKVSIKIEPIGTLQNPVE